MNGLKAGKYENAVNTALKNAEFFADNLVG